MCSTGIQCLAKGRLLVGYFIQCLDISGMGADVNFHYQNQQLLPKLTIRQAYIALSAFGLGLGLGHITRQQRHLVMQLTVQVQEKKGIVFPVSFWLLLQYGQREEDILQLDVAVDRRNLAKSTEVEPERTTGYNEPTLKLSKSRPRIHHRWQILLFGQHTLTHGQEMVTKTLQ